MNISNFMAWFINQFIYIGTTLLSKLDEITISGNITLMQFIITIGIIGAMLEILITSPRLNILNRTKETRNRQKAERKKEN